MKQLRDSAAGRFLAWALLLCAVFAAAALALEAVQAIPYLNRESYQDTAEFYRLLRSRENQIANAFAVIGQLDGDGLTYVERRQLTDELERFQESMKSAATNFRFIVRDANGEEVTSNLPEGEELPSPVYYASFVEGEHAALGTGTDGYVEPPGSITSHASTESPWLEEEETPAVYTIECGVVDRENWDEFAQLFYRFHNLRDNFSFRLAMAAACLALAFVCVLYILWTGGHKAGEEGIVLTWQEKIFFELYAAVMLITAVVAGAEAFDVLEWLVLRSPQSEQQLVRLAFAALCVLLAACVTLLLRTLAVRLKARAMARSTLLCRVLMWLWTTVREFVLGLPITWRAAVGFALYCMCMVFCFRYPNHGGPILFILLNTVVLLGLCRWTYCFRRLREGSDAIAAGDLNHQIDTTRMPNDLKLHAEALNNISVGLQNAVREQMKSERFKAELITNVSHDLKTPLTSIISYVDLLKSTQQTDPRAGEYIEVLDRKAQRLKKLTEDLVEASKASTGVLNVRREKLGMSQLIDQALGEYQEKLESKNLAVVATLPEEETFVYADGRHLWRVIDNLLSNCCKYALEGTRVYLELARGRGQVTLTVKNISREALNVPPERLMERFVRGDASRTTEGSGLGLSIARSLTELQGGAFELAVDGDLFKAIVTMPQAS